MPLFSFFHFFTIVSILSQGFILSYTESAIDKEISQTAMSVEDYYTVCVCVCVCVCSFSVRFKGK